MDETELPESPSSADGFNGLVDEAVLAPWGEEGPAPVGQWRRDVLGEGYESRTIPLMDDDAGPVVATLVRYQGHAASSPAPRFIALYIHGRNDYFFQRELAQNIADCAGAFYAIDLRRYGRSLRPGQRMGFISNLSLYDE